MMKLSTNLTIRDFQSSLDTFWELSGKKIESIEKHFESGMGAPVITINGKYTPRGWTEWTQGFQYGSALLHFEATGDQTFLKTGKDGTFQKMATHLTHKGVHDHGFNNISTYGNLLRLMVEGKLEQNFAEKEFYQLALKVSGAVQASRWSSIGDSEGFMYSFNGPHSLFVDTIRSCRILMLSHLLGHKLMDENDVSVNLLERAITHLKATARYSVFYGEGRDMYDVWGRTAHECIFNPNDGNFRCPNSQQGYSGFTTWTRGLAWAMCGFAEQLELADNLPVKTFEDITSKEDLIAILLRGAQATCDFYIENTPTDGIPYWDTGAPGLVHMGDYLDRPAEAFNDFEPVDSSAAAIGAQGLLRLGHYLKNRGREADGEKYWQAGLTVAQALLSAAYLSEDPAHEGLILHSIYHRPNGWDRVPEGAQIPSGESSMWGDYHARELMLYLSRIINRQPYYHFFNCIEGLSSGS